MIRKMAIFLLGAIVVFATLWVVSIATAGKTPAQPSSYVPPISVYATAPAVNEAATHDIVNNAIDSLWSAVHAVRESRR